LHHQLVVPRRPVVVAPRVVRPTVVAPRVVAPYHAPVFRPFVYPRPYVFRPHLRIGLGLFLGYPVPYAYAYPYTVPPYVYPYGPPPVAIVPGPTNFGGVSLEITPADADVYVDGVRAGVVRDFDGTIQPLTLPVGSHHIEIQANGYNTLAFDVMVQAGQVIPYRGELN
jgi:hypothetical protein